MCVCVGMCLCEGVYVCEGECVCEDECVCVAREALTAALSSRMNRLL